MCECSRSEQVCDIFSSLGGAQNVEAGSSFQHFSLQLEKMVTSISPKRTNCSLRKLVLDLGDVRAQISPKKSTRE